MTFGVSRSTVYSIVDFLRREGPPVGCLPIGELRSSYRLREHAICCPNMFGHKPAFNCADPSAAPASWTAKKWRHRGGPSELPLTAGRTNPHSKSVNSGGNAIRCDHNGPIIVRPHSAIQSEATHKVQRSAGPTFTACCLASGQHVHARIGKGPLLPGSGQRLLDVERQ